MSPLLLLMIILGLSAAIAWWQASRNSSEKPVRVMMFFGYFWLYTFIQVLLAVSIYLGWQYFFPN